MSKWYSDVPISAPEPHKFRPMISMSGFVFTDSCIAHEINEIEYTRFFVPRQPPVDPSNTIFADEHLDKTNTEYL
jgi:hypothetical protein